MTSETKRTKELSSSPSRETPKLAPTTLTISDTIEKKTIKVKVKRPLLELPTILTPVNNLKLETTGVIGEIPFTIRSKNGLTTIQWPTFSGIIDANGVSYLSTSQTLSGLPRYTLRWNITISYKGVDRTSFIEVDPGLIKPIIKFYINLNGGGEGVNKGDVFKVYGSNINWLT